MNRRTFLKTVISAGICFGINAKSFAGTKKFVTNPIESIDDTAIRDYLYKMRHFNIHHSDDVILPPESLPVLKSSLNRMKRLQATVGHGNFYLLNFDDALKIARNYSRVGRFTDNELSFLEMIFYEDGTHYGFLGEKPLKHLTDRIHKREVTKIPYTGNYLYKGAPHELYCSIKKYLGDDVVLTSGVRSVIKQFMLFLDKANQNKGNLSLASRSLAPPGYSFHGVGDFDVGRAGWGAANFTEEFTHTRVFRELKSLGYIKIRYIKDNALGVRFEPWHIKV